jgi:hypothetical protein
MNEKERKYRRLRINILAHKKMLENKEKEEKEIAKIVKNIELKLIKEAMQNFQYIKRKYYIRYKVSWIESIPNFINLLHFMAYMTAASASETFELQYNIRVPVQIIKRYMNRYPYKIQRMRAICDLKDYDDEELGLIQNSYIDKLEYKKMIRFNMLIYSQDYHSSVNDLAIMSGKIFGIPKTTQIHYRKKLIKNILK